jgi:hypothetical protein
MNIISSVEFKRPIWQTIAIFTLGFWLSTSLLIDWVIMPSFYVSGMMTQESFATVGYVIFWNFNRIELVAGGLVLTSVLALSRTKFNWSRVGIVLAVLLLAVSLAETYFLTPQMSAIGLHLNLFQTTTEIPTSMNLLHSSYWFLEAVKLMAASTLLNWCWRLN